MTREQQRTTADMLRNIPLGSVTKILYGIIGQSDDVRISVGSGEHSRRFKIKPDGTIVENQEVEVTL